MNRMMKDMSMDKKKSSSDGKGKEGKVDPALEKYLDPNQGEDSEDDSDQGEIIDASTSFLPSLPSYLDHD